MKRIQLKLSNGENYPAELSIGAMLLFRKETGKEASQADMNSVTDMVTLLWAGVASASEAAGKEFPYTVQQFANRLTSEALAEWTRAIVEDRDAEEAGMAAGDGSKKKTRRGSTKS